MRMDLRLPMGMMFTIFGALLLGFGVVSDRAIYERSLGVNINLLWGLVLLAFGVVNLALAAAARKRSPGGTGA